VTSLDDADLQSLEQFFVVMYDRPSADTSGNDARLNFFARKQRPYDAIPPQSALKLHSEHAAYQGRIIWGQATLSRPVTKSPAGWGGVGQVTRGRYFGLTLHQLLQVVEN